VKTVLARTLRSGMVLGDSRIVELTARSISNGMDSVSIWFTNGDHVRLDAKQLVQVK
jgi:hypothetical protein